MILAGIRCRKVSAERIQSVLLSVAFNACPGPVISAVLQLQIFQILRSVAIRKNKLLRCRRLEIWSGHKKIVNLRILSFRIFRLRYTVDAFTVRGCGRFHIGSGHAGHDQRANQKGKD